MASQAGLDVSQQETQICILDASGMVRWASTVRSEPRPWPPCCGNARPTSRGLCWRAARGDLKQRCNKAYPSEAPALALLAQTGPRPAVPAVPSGMDRRSLAAEGSRRCASRAKRASIGMRS